MVQIEAHKHTINTVKDRSRKMIELGELKSQLYHTHTHTDKLHAVIFKYKKCNHKHDHHTYGYNFSSVCMLYVDCLYYEYKVKNTEK